MAKYKKIIVAGPLVLEVVYPKQNPKDSQVVRQGKRKLSSEAQQRMNFKYAVQKLELELAANYGTRDLYVTLTYDDAHLPDSRKEAMARMKAFVARLRKRRKAKGQELRYHYNIEHKHGDGRWHHHAVINATGDDYGDIIQAWNQGNVEFKQIRVDREKNYLTLAKYLCKEKRDHVGDKLWMASKNILKPEVESFLVPNDEDIEAPVNALIFDDSHEHTLYGHYHFLKFLAPGWRSRPKPKAKKRKKKKTFI